MLEILTDYLREWNSTKNERQKLQHLYLALTAVIIICAAFISLVNPDFGHTVVQFGFAAIVVFVINGVAWNLLQSAVLTKLPIKRKRK